MRPAALMRGAMRKAIWWRRGSWPSAEVGGVEQRAEAGIAHVAAAAEAGWTMTRFSPVSGTTSATVAMATILRKLARTSGAYGVGQLRLQQRLNQLEGTPTPQSPLSG